MILHLKWLKLGKPVGRLELKPAFKELYIKKINLKVKVIFLQIWQFGKWELVAIALLTRGDPVCCVSSFNLLGRLRTAIGEN